MGNLRNIIILAALSAVLFFTGLGNMALTDPDETFYAETAKEMLEDGEWLTPMIFDEPQFEKPVLYYWLIMISYILFGVGEFAARFPSALFGFLGVLGIYMAGKKLYSPLCGLLSGVVAATCAEYLGLARGCVTDMVLTVTILYTLVFFLYGWTGEKKWYYYGAAVMAGLAALTKGPIGLFIPGMTMILFLSITKQWKRFFSEVPAGSSLLLLALVTLPWYLAVYKAHGSVFVDEFFGHHNVTRFTTPEHRIGSSPFFYIPVVIGGIFPWSIFFLWGVWDMFRGRRQTSDIRHQPEGQIETQNSKLNMFDKKVFLASWFLLVFLFFSASSTKLVTYIFPLFPVMAIITGRFWERFLLSGKDDTDRVPMRSAYIISAILLVVSPIAAIIVLKLEYPVEAIMAPAIAAAVIFASFIAVSAAFFFTDRRSPAFYSIAAAVLLMGFPINYGVLPVVGELESSRFLAGKVGELAGKDEAIGGECDHRRGIAFYSGHRDIENIHPPDALREFFSRDEKVWGIIQSKHYPQLEKDGVKGVSEPLYSHGGYVLITNGPRDRTSAE